MCGKTDVANGPRACISPLLSATRPRRAGRHFSTRKRCGLSSLDLLQLKCAPEIIQEQSLALTNLSTAKAQESSLPRGVGDPLRDPIYHAAVGVRLFFAGCPLQNGYRGSDLLQSALPQALGRRLPLLPTKRSFH